MAARLVLDAGHLGQVRAWSCSAALWDGEQSKDRTSGHPVWIVECSTDLGRFPVRVAAPTAPLPIGEYDSGRPVRLVRAAVTGWGKSGPYLNASAVEPVEGK